MFKVGDYVLCKQSSYNLAVDVPLNKKNKLYEIMEIDFFFSDKYYQIKGEETGTNYISYREDNFFKFFYTEVEMRKYKLLKISQNEIC